MTMLVTNNLLLNETPQMGFVRNNNISYRANETSVLERIPDSDTFDNKKKSGKPAKIIASLIAAAAVVVGAICFSKGKAPEGTAKKFGERMKDGWNKLCRKSKDVAEDVSDKLEENVSDVGNKTKNTTKKTKKTSTESKKTKNSAKKTEQAKAAKEAEEARKIREAEEKALAAKEAKLDSLSKLSINKCKKEQIQEYAKLRYNDDPIYVRLYGHCADSEIIKKRKVSLQGLSDIIDNELFPNGMNVVEKEFMKTDFWYKKINDLKLGDSEDAFTQILGHERTENIMEVLGRDTKFIDVATSEEIKSGLPEGMQYLCKIFEITDNNKSMLENTLEILAEMARNLN